MALAGGLSCLALFGSTGATMAGSQVEKKIEAPPEAPGYASEAMIMAAIATGKIKTVQSPKEMPPGVQMVKDVEYGKVGERPLLLDLYTPAKLKKAAPGLIFIHGGAWKGGNKDMYRVYAVRYAQRGYVVVSISYRLSKEAPFPAAVEDAKCAVRWMRANSSQYKIDPDHICVLGGSAGGHLALMVGYTSEQKDLEGSGGWPGVSSKVQAVVDIYGPCDLSLPGIRDADSVRQFLGGKTYDESPELYQKASPLLQLTKDDPPTLILHGTLDSLVPVSQSDKLAERLKQVGVPCTYDRLEGWPHVMDLAEVVFNRCVFFIDRFLAENMPVPEPATAE